MKVYPTNRYVVGDYKKTCARCGFDYLRSELRKDGQTGSLVCDACWDPRHPQDLPRAPMNRPNPVRD